MYIFVTKMKRIIISKTPIRVDTYISLYSYVLHYKEDRFVHFLLMVSFPMAGKLLTNARLLCFLSH